MRNFSFLRDIRIPESLADERVIRRGDFNMRLVINRPHGHMRVMDYRAGNYEEKRNLLDDFARQEGLRKIFILGEKQDSNSWRSVGFTREGACPSFFRTADAYMVSRFYNDLGDPVRIEQLKPSSKELIRFPGRRLQKPDGLSVTPVLEPKARAGLFEQANGDLRALPFAEAKAPDVVILARARAKRAYACAEIDESFAHAAIGFTPIPTTENQMTLAAYAGKQLIEQLVVREVQNIYGISPIDDRWTNELMAGLGFKVTGRLSSHLHCKDGWTHALLWNQRIASAPKEQDFGPAAK